MRRVAPVSVAKVAAMERREGTYQGRAEDRDEDLEHLPPLLEDEVGQMAP